MRALTIMAKKLFGLSPTPEDYGTVWAQAPLTAGVSSDSTPLEKKYVATLTPSGLWTVDVQSAERRGTRLSCYWEGSTHDILTTEGMLDFLREHDKTRLPDSPNHVSRFVP